MEESRFKWQDAVGILGALLAIGGMADMPLALRVTCFVLCAVCMPISFFSHRSWPRTAQWIGSITIVLLMAYMVFHAVSAASPKVAKIVTLEWHIPRPIEAGTALTADQLNASAWSGGVKVDGEYVYDPTFGATLPVGTQTLRVIFAPTDTASYFSKEKTISILVNQQPSSSTPPLIASRLKDEIVPVSVKAHIDSKQVLHLENHGKASITDVALRWASFTPTSDLYTTKKIAFASSSFVGGESLHAAKIDKGKDIHIPLETVVRFTSKFPDWDGLPAPEIGLRITFRDSQTGLKYSCYKVFSSIRGMPESWGDETAVSNGASGPLWIDELPNLVIELMKKQLKDGAVEYECDR